MEKVTTENKDKKEKMKPIIDRLIRYKHGESVHIGFTGSDILTLADNSSDFRMMQYPIGDVRFDKRLPEYPDAIVIFSFDKDKGHFIIIRELYVAFQYNKEVFETRKEAKIPITDLMEPSNKSLLKMIEWLEENIPEYFLTDTVKKLVETTAWIVRNENFGIDIDLECAVNYFKKCVRNGGVE